MPARRPWWLYGATVRARFVLGGVELAIGLWFLNLVMFAHHSEWLWFALFWLAAGAFQFALGVARGCHERSRPDSDGR